MARRTGRVGMGLRRRSGLMSVRTRHPPEMHAKSVIAVLAACCAVAAGGLSVLPYADYVKNGTGDKPQPGGAKAPAAPELSDKDPDRAATSASPSSTTPISSTAAEEETTTASSSTTTEDPVQKDCQDQIGQILNDVPVNTMRKYDMWKILGEHGGAPGKVNATFNKDVPEFPGEDVKDKDEESGPDPDNGTYWVYDYRYTDYKTHVRLEHALLRNKGKNDEYLDIRGQLYWTPPDFCNRARHAYYKLDNQGFQANVTLEYCDLSSEELWCAFPASCKKNDTYFACVAAPSGALLASLVG